MSGNAAIQDGIGDSVERRTHRDRQVDNHLCVNRSVFAELISKRVNHLQSYPGSAADACYFVKSLKQVAEIQNGRERLFQTHIHSIKNS